MTLPLATVTQYDVSGTIPVVRGPTGGLRTLTYGPSIAIDIALGLNVVVTLTDAVAFVFAAPTLGGAAITAANATVGSVLNIRIRNAAGAPHGAGTFNAVFLGAAVPAIANGNSREFQFILNGTPNWVDSFRSAADIPN